MLKILDKGSPLAFSDLEELTLVMSDSSVILPFWQNLLYRIKTFWGRVREWLM